MDDDKDEPAEVGELLPRFQCQLYGGELGVKSDVLCASNVLPWPSA